MNSYKPWMGRPIKESWYQMIHDSLYLWFPYKTLEIDRGTIIANLTKAIDCRASWLVHPCVNALSFRQEKQHPQRDFLLITWLAAHSQSDLGEIQIPHPLWMWTPDGGILISEGKHDLQTLGHLVVEHQSPSKIALDVWCHSVGFSYPGSWATEMVLTNEQQQQLKQEIALFFKTLSVAEAWLEDCMTWITDVTKVIIPLRSQRTASFRSGSQQDVPGLIFCDLDVFGGEIQILEAIVHESAHLHFFMAEVARPLVDPEHQGRYSSPLRSDPRSLRGIFLAYHALAYICALYTELIHQGIGDLNTCFNEMEILQAKLEASRQLLLTHQQYLTKAGISFFEQTEEVVCYGRY
jgi:hypothetical protein